MDDEPISRRELLRNIVATGVLTWAAPVLTRLPADASVDRCRKKWSRKLCRGSCGDCFCDNNWCGNCGSLGAYCFIEIGTGALYCGNNVFCDEVQTCLSTSECPKGNVCITENGCTGCGDSIGVCVPRCCTASESRKPPHRVRHLGPTAAGERAAAR